MRNIEEEILENVTKKYLRIKRNYIFNSSTKIEMSLNEKNNNFVELVDTVLSTLPYEYEIIIRNDYLSNLKVVKWWHPYFSKSTYFRKKRKAIEQFVDCFKF